jgi:hypothetical protein
MNRPLILTLARILIAFIINYLSTTNTETYYGVWFLVMVGFLFVDFVDVYLPKKTKL